MITKNQFGVFYSVTVFTCLWGIYLFNFKNPNPNKKYSFGECLFEYIRPTINRNWELDREKCLDGWSIIIFYLLYWFIVSKNIV